jgi:hypothetical protein
MNKKEIITDKIRIEKIKGINSIWEIMKDNEMIKLVFEKEIKKFKIITGEETPVKGKKFYFLKKRNYML